MQIRVGSVVGITSGGLLLTPNSTVVDVEFAGESGWSDARICVPLLDS